MEIGKCLVVLLFLGASGVDAATASHTGNFDYIQTVTGKSGVRCEYQVYGEKFWMVFSGYRCPRRVEVD